MRVETKKIVVKDAITIEGSKSVRSASSFMNYFNVDCLLVTDDKYPVGIITRSDLDKNEMDLDVVEINEVMSEPLIWVRYNTTLSEVAELMEQESINKVPIFGNLSSGPILLGVYVHKEERLEIMEEA